MAEKRKRLEIWLPADHPLWKLPEGQRAKVARAVLEAAFGRKAAGQVFAALDTRLAAIEEALTRLEEAVRAGPANTGPQEEETTTIPDPDDFLSAFE
ncbi:hypothetical protein Desku_1609 [Desulfofundulus kuznetsovii DSM 6115]|uniref:Plasmid segregation centromere-binding protein ParR n=1 Tax=Desulfofundulus kuznetsovii (strain DSM 6115 / VKM B-1805 / 17) TaxID=760568 RepID=A0AAU8PVR9_DESK7|nr:hypothetical protein Desku_1609 [Desulfofundulus kuznetsovii DSM 6115]